MWKKDKECWELINLNYGGQGSLGYVGEKRRLHSSGHSLDTPEVKEYTAYSRAGR